MIHVVVDSVIADCGEVAHHTVGVRGRGYSYVSHRKRKRGGGDWVAF